VSEIETPRCLPVASPGLPPFPGSRQPRTRPEACRTRKRDPSGANAARPRRAITPTTGICRVLFHRLHQARRFNAFLRRDFKTDSSSRQPRRDKDPIDTRHIASISAAGAMDIDDILREVDPTFDAVPRETRDLQALTRAWVAERSAPELLE